MPRVTFLPAAVEVQARQGAILLDVALDHEIPVNHNCGGNCACATCHVFILHGLGSLNEMSEAEKDMLAEVESRQGNSRLACQCRISADLVVFVPPTEPGENLP